MHDPCLPRLNSVCLAVVILMIHYSLIFENLTKYHDFLLLTYMWQYKESMEMSHIKLLTLVFSDGKGRMRYDGWGEVMKFSFIQCYIDWLITFINKQLNY